eukprot:5884468-Pleurochrysis_carterae.AAC.10
MRSNMITRRLPARMMRVWAQGREGHSNSGVRACQYICEVSTRKAVLCRHARSPPHAGLPNSSTTVL